MGADSSSIGLTSEAQVLEVSRSRLRFFANATGQKDPVYSDLDAAQAAGHRDLPVPPTFFFGIEMEASDPFAWISDLGIDLRTVLHGEQEFVYHRLAFADDVLTARSEIRNVYEKRGGALQFIVRVTTVTDAAGELVAEMTGTTVVRSMEIKD